MSSSSQNQVGRCGNIPWWRAHDGLPFHPRWRLIARKSGQSIPTVIAVAVALLDHASSTKPRGNVSAFDAEVIAAAYDVDETVVASIVSAFNAAGWIDGDGHMTTWDHWQVIKEGPSPVDRQRNKRKRDGEAAARDVTPSHAPSRSVTPEKIRGDQSKSEHSKEDSLSAPARGGEESLRRSIGEFFDDEVWPAYPNSTKANGRIPARHKFAELVMGGADPDEILAGVERYAATHPDPDFAKSLVKFLADEDWNEGLPVAERDYDANEAETLIVKVDTREARMATTDAIVDAFFSADDGTPREEPFFPKEFGKPPIGGWLAAA